MGGSGGRGTVKKAPPQRFYSEKVNGDQFQTLFDYLSQKNNLFQKIEKFAKTSLLKHSQLAPLEGRKGFFIAHCF
jgi:hypothetical protein